MHILRRWGRKAASGAVISDDASPAPPTTAPGDGSSAAPPPPHPAELLPTLPSPRRPLTPPPPPPSSAAAAAAARVVPAAVQQASSPFFTLLPPEIRQQIYVFAFGGRELHLDLAFTRAEMRAPHSIARATVHADRAWRWRASACHRHPDADAAWDRCVTGAFPTACALYGGTAGSHDPDGSRVACRVGAMGWLRSCRAAYVEGVGVLYGTNCFHVGTGALLVHPGLLVPHHTAAIASLVMALQEGSIVVHAAAHLGLPAPGWPAYRRLVAAVAEAFPGLRRLCVVLHASVEECGLWKAYSPSSYKAGLADRGMRIPGDRRRLLEIGLMEPLDALLRAFAGRLEECEFVLPDRLFDFLVGQDGARLTAGPPGSESERERLERFWRPVEGVPCGGTAGYWIRRVPSYAEAVIASLHILPTAETLTGECPV